MLDITLIFVGGFFAAFFGAMGGGGAGFLGFLPFLLLGYPVHVALGTYRVTDLGLFATSLYNFHRAKKIIWQSIVPLVSLALIAGLIGSRLVIAIDPRPLKILMIAAMTGIFLFLLLRPQLGIIRREIAHRAWMPVYFGVSLYGGMIGVGGGPLGVATLCVLRGFTFLEAAATHFFGNTFVALATVGVFAWYGYIEWQLAAYGFLGNLIGGYIGSHVALRRGNGFMRYVLLSIVLVTIGRLVWDVFIA